MTKLITPVQMTLQEITVSRVQELPEPILAEVNTFLDTIDDRISHINAEGPLLQAECSALADADTGYYLTNLESYEASLAQDSTTTC
jgi:hypothetical protein